MAEDAYDTKIADWQAMRSLVQAGRQHHFNRQIPQKLFDALDPDGYSVLTIALFDHERHWAGDPLHHRCQALLKLKDNDNPYLMFIDILDEDYRALPRGVRTPKVPS